MKILLRYLKHRAKILFSFAKTNHDILDYWAQSIISIAGRWKGEVDPVLTYTAMFDVLRQRGFSGSFWELGGGYSTILAPLLLRKKLRTINSIDFNPDKYDRILNSVRLKRKFCRSINLISDITVSLEQVKLSVEAMVQEICIYPKKEIFHALTKFVSKEHMPTKDKNLKDWLIKTFLEHPHYKEELKFYNHFDAITGEKLCSSLVYKNTKIDALFLDCGEISSIAEFCILRHQMTPRSYILLHDIYYPKSIKNYLVGTLLILDESWELLYIDSVSAQGGCVFQKVV